MKQKPGTTTLQWTLALSMTWRMVSATVSSATRQAKKLSTSNLNAVLGAFAGQGSDKNRDDSHVTTNTCVHFAAGGGITRGNHNAVVGSISDWSPMDASSACQQQWEFVKIKVMSLGVIPAVTQWNT